MLQPRRSQFSRAIAPESGTATKPRKVPTDERSVLVQKYITSASRQNRAARKKSIDFTGPADVRLRVAYQFRPRRCHAGLGARDAGLECSCRGSSGLSGRLADFYQSAMPHRGCLRRPAAARLCSPLEILPGWTRNTTRQNAVPFREAAYIGPARGLTTSCNDSRISSPIVDLYTNALFMAFKLSRKDGGRRQLVKRPLHVVLAQHSALQADWLPPAIMNNWRSSKRTDLSLGRLLASLRSNSSGKTNYYCAS